MREKNVLLAVLLFSLIFISACAQSEPDIFDINLREHKNLALHIHPTLQIEIEGENITIPANMGISPEGMRVIHTHDTSGKLHVESPFPHQFVLQDLFTIWGKTFTNECIFDKCIDENHALKVFVNDVETDQFGDTLLLDGDLIRVVYRENDN